MDFSFFFDLNSIISFIIALLLWTGFAYILKLWKDIAPLKTIYIGVASVVGSALTALFFILLSQIFSFPFIPSRLEGMNNSNFALAFIGTVSGLGGLFAIYLAILRSDELKRQNDIAIKTNKITEEQNVITNRQNDIANRQAHTAEQESITERINKAVDKLAKTHTGGKPALEARLGTLYDLERIAKDSERDHGQILEMLCSYIQLNSPITDAIKKMSPTTKRTPRKDIQTALTIIGRHDSWLKDKNQLKTEDAQRERGRMIDLSNCDLWGVRIFDANLSHAKFHNAILNDAYIYNINMSGTDFNGADMVGTWIDRSNLKRAGFNNANMFHIFIVNRTNLERSHFHNTNISNAMISSADLHNSMFTNTNLTKAEIKYSNLDEVIFRKTRLKGVNLTESYAYKGDFSEYDLTQKQLDVMYCGIDVKIPKGLTRPDHWPVKKLSKDEFMKEYKKWEGIPLR